AETAYCLQPCRTVRQFAVLRSARGQLSGAEKAEVHRLQSAWTDTGARQSADQEDLDLSPHRRAALCGVRAAQKDCSTRPLDLSDVREVANRGSLRGYFASLFGPRRRETYRADRLHP